MYIYQQSSMVVMPQVKELDIDLSNSKNILSDQCVKMIPECSSHNSNLVADMDDCLVFNHGKGGFNVTERTADGNISVSSEQTSPNATQQNISLKLLQKKEFEPNKLLTTLSVRTKHKPKHRLSADTMEKSKGKCMLKTNSSSSSSSTSSTSGSSSTSSGTSSSSDSSDSSSSDSDSTSTSTGTTSSSKCSRSHTVETDSCDKNNCINKQKRLINREKLSKHNSINIENSNAHTLHTSIAFEKDNVNQQVLKGPSLYVNNNDSKNNKVSCENPGAEHCVSRMSDSVLSAENDKDNTSLSDTCKHVNDQSISLSNLLESNDREKNDAVETSPTLDTCIQETIDLVDSMPHVTNTVKNHSVKPIKVVIKSNVPFSMKPTKPKIKPIKLSLFDLRNAENNTKVVGGTSLLNRNFNLHSSKGRNGNHYRNRQFEEKYSHKLTSKCTAGYDADINEFCNRTKERYQSRRSISTFHRNNERNDKLYHHIDSDKSRYHKHRRRRSQDREISGSKNWSNNERYGKRQTDYRDVERTSHHDSKNKYDRHYKENYHKKYCYSDSEESDNTVYLNENGKLIYSKARNTDNSRKSKKHKGDKKCEAKRASCERIRYTNKTTEMSQCDVKQIDKKFTHPNCEQTKVTLPTHTQNYTISESVIDSLQTSEKVAAIDEVKNQVDWPMLPHGHPPLDQFDDYSAYLAYMTNYWQIYSSGLYHNVKTDGTSVHVTDTDHVNQYDTPTLCEKVSSPGGEIDTCSQPSQSAQNKQSDMLDVRIECSKENKLHNCESNVFQTETEKCCINHSETNCKICSCEINCLSPSGKHSNSVRTSSVEDVSAIVDNSATQSSVDTAEKEFSKTVLTDQSQKPEKGVGKVSQCDDDTTHDHNIKHNKYEPHYKRDTAGYCFVEFPDGDDARQAMLRLNGKVVPGSRLPIKRFKLNHASFGREHLLIPEYSLFVGDLSEDVDDLCLYSVFSKRYQSCRSANVVQDGSGLSRGYGFVRFTSEEDQQAALIEMQRFESLGKKCIRVSVATQKRPMQVSYQQQQQQYQQYQQQYQQYYQAYNQWYMGYGGGYPTYAPGTEGSQLQDQMGQGDYSQTGQVTDENNQQMEDDQELEDPEEEIDVEKANKEFMEKSEEVYLALEGSRWHPLDNVMSSITDNTIPS